MPSVSIDAFPARVTLPDGRLMSAIRVIESEGKILVYAEPANRAEEPPLVWSSDLVSIEGSNGSGWTALTVDGVVNFRVEGGCGCGSRLKNWVPFPNYSFAPMAPSGPFSIP
jgi:hypothetical protein